MNVAGSRVVLAIFAVLALTTLAGCGGGGDDRQTAEPNLFDPARADEIAHAALLTAADLPGTGWEIDSEDKFDDSNEPLADTKACRSIAAQREANRKKSDPARRGRAQREFAADRGDIFPVSVEVELHVFSSVTPVSEGLAAAKGYLGGGDFQRCFEELIKASVNEGVDVVSKTARSTSPVPADGAVVAVDLAIRAEGEEAVLRLETYVWRSSNIGVTVTITAARDRVTKELTAAVLAKVQENLQQQETR